MTAPVVSSSSTTVPRPRRPVGRFRDGRLPDGHLSDGRLSDGTASPAGTGRAAAYQRVLHQLVRRELRTLADVAAWAPDGDRARTATVIRHSELISRVLLHHHGVERESVWPALLRAVGPADRADAEDAVSSWTVACSRIDARLRDLDTSARQWCVAGTAPARIAFVRACRALADDVAAQTAEEERALVPLLDRWLPDGTWAVIARRARSRLPARQRLLVLGLALEDSCAGDRCRLLGGIPWTTRLAWRLYGARRYRAGVVRLRGAPPAC
ncbi:MAG TPA: hemerythrin domain-containing protein [Blastococcus sp.]|nr:hemerythrin domain-containing protein [Blastococcus sp.]